MNTFKRTLYLIEFSVAFAPSLLVLILGVIFSPLFLLALFNGELSTALDSVLVVLVSLGYWGAISGVHDEYIFM